jgi:CRP/FNR family transcriptional regulator
MNTAVTPKSRRLPLMLYGDVFAQRQCTVCDAAAFCLAEHEAAQMRRLDAHVEHSGAYPQGSYLFRLDDPLLSLLIVRTGTVKLFVGGDGGGEQILGFAQAGDAIGLDAIDGSRYQCNAMALETVSLCQLSFTMVTRLSTELPTLQRSLLNLLSRHLATTYQLFGKHAAEQRLSAFLMSLSRHAERRGLSPYKLHLGMPRSDLANYLRLTPETVSRLLRRFQQQGLLQVERREVHVLDLLALQKLAGNMLRE